jgi:hypothetical protein
MKTTLTLIALAATFTLSAPASEPLIGVKCVVGSPDNTTSLPTAHVKSGSTAKITSAESLRFPTKWDLPKEGVNDEGQKFIVPVTPTEFESIDPEWSIEYTSEQIENGLIRIVGVVTYQKPELQQAVHGERAAPIYSPDDSSVLLTENKAQGAVIQSSATRFQLFAKVGKEYTFDVRKLNEVVPITMSCSINK